MKKINKILTLMMLVGTVGTTTALTSIADASEINHFSGEWGDDNGKFPDQGPEVLKIFENLAYSNKKLSNFSAIWTSTGSYTGVHSMRGSATAEGELGNFVTYSGLVDGYIEGEKYDGTTQKWKLSSLSSAKLFNDNSSLINNTKLSFIISNESIPTSQFSKFNVVMNVQYDYYLNGWDYMMSNNKQKTVIKYSFGF